jgi:hypothetical protein
LDRDDPEFAEYLEYYTAADRELQWESLRNQGEPPTPADVTALTWPQRDWWGDRDRIVLMHERLECGS